MLFCTNKLQFSCKLIFIVVVAACNNSYSGGEKKSREAEASGELIIRKCQAKALCENTMSCLT